MADDLKTLMGALGAKYRPGVFKTEKSLYITLGEAADQKWTVYAGPSACRVEQGKTTDKADCVLKMKQDLFIKMIQGKYLPGMMDFMRGMVKTNDPDLLMKFKDALNF